VHQKDRQRRLAPRKLSEAPKYIGCLENPYGPSITRFAGGTGEAGSPLPFLHRYKMDITMMPAPVENMVKPESKRGTVKVLNGLEILSRRLPKIPKRTGMRREKIST
jgi:hypothetical protein